MGIKLSRDQTITVSWSTLASIVGSLTAVWMFAGPLAESALAGEIAKQVAPLTTAQVITITATVKNLQKQIAALEFKRDMCRGSDCWSVRDQEDLASAKDDLVAAQAALTALKK